MSFIFTFIQKMFFSAFLQGIRKLPFLTHQSAFSYGTQSVLMMTFRKHRFPSTPIKLSPAQWNYLEKNSYNRMRNLEQPYGIALEIHTQSSPSYWIYPKVLSSIKLSQIILSGSNLLHDYPHKAYDGNQYVYLGREAINLELCDRQGVNHNSTLWVFDSAMDVLSSIPDWSLKDRFIPKKNYNHSLEQHAVIQGGKDLSVDTYSVCQRFFQKRLPSERDVMLSSASQAYSHFYKIYGRDLLHHEKTAIDSSLQACKNRDYSSAFYPEWCHLYGFALTPLNQNPQHPLNLAAAPRWFNNEMLVCEKIVSCLAHLNRSLTDTQLRLTLCTHFWSLNNVVLKGSFTTTMEYKRHIVKTHQTLFPAHPLLFRRAGDSAVIAAIAVAFMNGHLDLRSSSNIKTYHY